jgi:ceramide glucosyltransferase
MLIAGWILLALALAGAAFAVAAILAVGRTLAGTAPAATAAPAVTILKPLHGAEPGLEAALASCLEQDYPAPVQIVCGVQDASDPAAAVVGRLKARFGDRDIVLVQSAKTHGANAKVSNLVNMSGAAAHGVLVLADSDIAVPRHWLAAVVAALSAPGVGVVSCFYAGMGQGGWARFAAMGISYGFLPNAVLGAASGLAHPCFGSTIALRRETLDEIGGFAAFRDTLADDYEIGRAVRRRGHRLVYPPVLVRHLCTEATFGELWRHELRWARTIRTVDPLGHFGSAVTHAVPLALIGAAFASFSPAALVVLAAVVAARLSLKGRIDHIAGTAAGPAWLLPARDMLSFAVFVASLAGGTVSWRGDRLRIGTGGEISRQGG